MSYFLMTMQGSTSEILPSWDLPPHHTHTIPSTPLQMPERTQSTCLNVRHPGSGRGKAKQYTNHMQQADLLLQLLFKTWLFVQAGFWSIWFGAGQAEPTNWMIACCATTKAEKEGASGIIQVLDCFFQQVFFQFTVGHWHQKVQQQQPQWWNCRCYNRREIKWSICWSGSTRKWLRHHMTEDVHSVAEGRIYLQARLPPDSTKGSFG